MANSACRDCFTTPAGVDRCRACGSHRLVVHDELAALTVAHIDCDAFYASVEKRDRPELADQPVIIGGGRRGVVATACYIARAFGVRSAMPMFKARAACPDAVVIKPDMAKYVAESRRIRAMMEALTPAVEPISIDEAFLDLAGTERVHAAAPSIALMRLQSAIEREVGVTVSVGLSHNKFLAKVASDQDKPRGFFIIGKAETLTFLADKPVSLVPGVGAAFAKRLQAEGLTTLGQVRRRDERDLARSFGDAGLRLARLSRGLDHRAVSRSSARKSVSSETTFHDDARTLSDLEAHLWRVCVRLADRAKAASVAGLTVTLKLKTADHRSFTRQRALDQPVQLADALFQIAKPLLTEAADGRAFRLLGVGLSHLCAAPQSDGGDLLDPDAARRAAAERAVDRLRDKFGDDAVFKGRNLTAPKGD